MASPLQGVFAPVVTPVDAGLAPDPERLGALCHALLADGCHGLVLFGTTSEANSFALDERMALLEAVVAAGVPAEKLIVGTGLCAIPETTRLTRHAVDLGCAGTLVLPPFYYKGQSDAGLHAAYAEVIERVGAARLRLYLYHIPQVSGVGITFPLIQSLVAAYPEQVVGIKDSTGDADHHASLLAAFPGFGVFTGTETLLLANQRGGGVGTITAGANVNARAIRRLYDGSKSAEADALQAKVDAVRQALQGAPLVAGLKAVIAHQRGDHDWRRVRPPLVALDDGARDALLAALDAAGYQAP